MYYDLMPFSRPPELIVHELGELAKSRPDVPPEHTLEAKYQLALCHAAGFGLDYNPNEAVRLLTDLAVQRHLKAQLSLWPVAAGLGIGIDGDIFRDLKAWMDEAARRQSFFAMNTLAALTADRPESSIPSWHPLGESEQPNLLWAAHFGNTAYIQEALRTDSDTGTLGPYGETALHRAALYQGREVSVIVELLLDGGVLGSTRTQKAVGLFDDGSNLEYLVRGTTAFDWAISVDNAAVVETFVHHSPETYPITLDSLIQACTNLSIASLGFMIKELQARGEWTTIRSQTRDGCTLMYWALRPDFFQHLLSHPPDRQATHKTLVQRQLDIVWELKNAGCPWATHKNDLFSSVHMLASYGQPQILDGFLSRLSADTATLVDKTSRYGWTPIRDTIIRGRRDAFHILLRHGASLKNIHALNYAAHICALSEEDLTLEFASEVVKRDDKACKRRNAMGNTPLHYAGAVGNEELIRFWLDQGADPLAYNKGSYTALGASLSVRSVAGVRALQAVHVSRGLPINGARQSVSDSLLVPGPRRSHTALSMLLAPGFSSPFETRRKLRFPALFVGCNDLAWCSASQAVLEVLLEGYKNNTRWGVNFTVNVFVPSDENSGMDHAVRYGNLAAVRRLHDAMKFDFYYRSLIQTACDQLHLGPEHPSPLPQRRLILDSLLSWQKAEFTAKKVTRCSSALGPAWKLYYILYGNSEQSLYLRSVDWQQNNRFQGFRPLFAEFYLWPRCRYPFMLIQCFVVIALLTPLVVSAALILSDEVYYERNSVRVPILAVVSGLVCILHSLSPFTTQC